MGTHESAQVGQLKAVDALHLAETEKAHQGKVLARKDSISKLSDKARSVVQAIFVGSEGLQAMDGWSRGINNDPAGPLCTYQNWNTNCAAEAADKWIALNSAHDGYQGVWPSYFW